MSFQNKLWYKVLNTKVRVSVEKPKILRVDQMREIGSLEGVPKILKLFGYHIYAVATLEEHSTPRYFVISKLKLKKDHLYFYADFPGRLDLDKEWQAVIVDDIYQPYKLIKRFINETPVRFKCIGSFNSCAETRQFIADSELSWETDDYYCIREYYTDVSIKDPYGLYNEFN